MNDQDQDWNAMQEARTDRKIFAEMPMIQPQVTDFTEIQPVTQPPLGDYHVCVILDSGIVPIAKGLSLEDAQKAELAISQAMIEYRTKRNAWEKELAESRLKDAALANFSREAPNES